MAEGMSLTEAVKAVNEAGFTLRLEREFHTPENVGWFKAGDGRYEVTDEVEWIDGHIVRGVAGVVTSGFMTTPEEVIGKLGHRDPAPQREYVEVDPDADTGDGR